ncbi:hypothetical protein, partial [Pseudomonas citronellolis]|uniref:hypothetical protein n=1 Tax=Pseudomonas citronellolis TaxID=53408 RepID=UPI001EDC3274
MSQEALHVVLAAQRIHADAFAADVAGRHREGSRCPSPSSSLARARSRQARSRSPALPPVAYSRAAAR